MNQSVSAVLMINMIMNIFIIGAVIKLAQDGVCVEPVHYTPPILKDEKP